MEKSPSKNDRKERKEARDGKKMKQSFLSFGKSSEEQQDKPKKKKVKQREKSKDNTTDNEERSKEESKGNGDLLAVPNGNLANDAISINSEASQRSTRSSGKKRKLQETTIKEDPELKESRGKDKKPKMSPVAEE